MSSQLLILAVLPYWKVLEILRDASWQVLYDCKMLSVTDLGQNPSHGSKIHLCSTWDCCKGQFWSLHWLLSVALSVLTECHAGGVNCCLILFLWESFWLWSPRNTWFYTDVAKDAQMSLPTAWWYVGKVRKL